MLYVEDNGELDMLYVGASLVKLLCYMLETVVNLICYMLKILW